MLTSAGGLGILWLVNLFLVAGGRLLDVDGRRLVKFVDWTVTPGDMMKAAGMIEARLREEETPLGL